MSLRPKHKPGKWVNDLVSKCCMTRLLVLDICAASLKTVKLCLLPNENQKAADLEKPLYAFKVFIRLL